jgi:hypothetical protein
MNIPGLKNVNILNTSLKSQRLKKQVSDEINAIFIPDSSIKPILKEGQSRLIRYENNGKPVNRSLCGDSKNFVDYKSFLKKLRREKLN